MWREEERETLLASVSPALHPTSVAHCSVCSHKCLCVTDSYFQFLINSKWSQGICWRWSRCCDIRTDGQTDERPPGQKVSRWNHRGSAASPSCLQSNRWLSSDSRLTVQRWHSTRCTPIRLKARRSLRTAPLIALIVRTIWSAWYLSPIFTRSSQWALGQTALRRRSWWRRGSRRQTRRPDADEEKCEVEMGRRLCADWELKNCICWVVISQCDGVNFKCDLNIRTRNNYKLCSESQAFSSFLMNLCAKKYFCLFCRNTERCEIKPPKKSRRSNRVRTSSWIHWGQNWLFPISLPCVRHCVKWWINWFWASQPRQMTRLTAIISAIQTNTSIAEPSSYIIRSAEIS